MRAASQQGAVLDPWAFLLNRSRTTGLGAKQPVVRVVQPLTPFTHLSSSADDCAAKRWNLSIYCKCHIHPLGLTEYASAKALRCQVHLSDCRVAVAVAAAAFAPSSFEAC